MAIHIKLRAVRPATAEWILRASEYIFFLIGAAALGYYFYIAFDAKLYQDHLSKTLQESRETSAVAAHMEEASGTPALPAVSPEPRPAPVNPERPAVAKLPEATFGQIEIRAIGLKAMIAEGVDSRTLRRAVGHIPGTRLPGESGNVAIAGHRDTFFRPLRDIHRNDEITLTTARGSFRYVVDFTELVGPENTAVLDDSDKSLLTLVTCYPFYYVGPAPKRFIVRAHLAPA